MDGTRPTVDHVYQNFVMDSSRWSRWTPRGGDVLVCTSYKAGTTWTQMICGLLIHQTPTLPRPLAELSPWIDMLLSPIDEVIANCDGQAHRRFVKTHTPLDALPYFPNATYLVCGRDPRDVFMSMQHHMSNLDVMKAMSLVAAQGLAVTPPDPPPDDIDERFEQWLTRGSHDWETDGYPFWSHFRHAQTFWAYRHLPNIHFLHYADLQADLEGQMRRIAGLLGVTVEEAAWPALVKAATFAEMKANADRVAPDTHHGIWVSNRDFFHKGESAQWKGALSEANLRLYEEVKRARYDPQLVDWLERGRAAVDPKVV